MSAHALTPRTGPSAALRMRGAKRATLPGEFVITWTLGNEGAAGAVRWNFRVTDTGWVAEAVLIAPDVPARVIVEVMPIACTLDDDLDIVHFDAGPRLRVSIRGGDQPRLLYARTDVLASLHILGGRASAPACDFAHVR